MSNVSAKLVGLTKVIVALIGLMCVALGILIVYLMSRPQFYLMILSWIEFGHDLISWYT